MARLQWTWRNDVFIKASCLLLAGGCSLNGRLARFVALMSLHSTGACSAFVPPDFQTEIQPIFVASCVPCHNAEHPQAQLWLDSLEWRATRWQFAPGHRNPALEG